MGDLPRTPMSTKREYKFGTDAFLKRTPSLFRRIGNMFFSISSLGGTFAFLMEDKRIAVALFAMAVLGKALTEFFSQEELEKDYDTVEPTTDSDASTIVSSLTGALPDVVAAVTEDKMPDPVPVKEIPLIPVIGHVFPVDDNDDSINE